jgi:hypothetical protein
MMVLVLKACRHCKNGWFDGARFGIDVECVNGVLIDIDEAHEGWSPDVIYRAAPCHPNPDGEGFALDSQERLRAWSAS